MPFPHLDRSPSMLASPAAEARRLAPVASRCCCCFLPTGPTACWPPWGRLKPLRTRGAQQGCGGGGEEFACMHAWALVCLFAVGQRQGGSASAQRTHAAPVRNAHTHLRVCPSAA